MLKKEQQPRQKVENDQQKVSTLAIEWLKEQKPELASTITERSVEVVSCKTDQLYFVTIFTRESQQFNCLHLYVDLKSNEVKPV